MLHLQKRSVLGEIDLRVVNWQGSWKLPQKLGEHQTKNARCVVFWRDFPRKFLIVTLTLVVNWSRGGRPSNPLSFNGLCATKLKTFPAVFCWCLGFLTNKFLIERLQKACMFKTQVDKNDVVRTWSMEGSAEKRKFLTLRQGSMWLDMSGVH